jgi:leader peptidase (prepilin peptidase) / N-methyltransferase
MSEIEILFILACGLFGLLFGSFGNVAIYRIPREIPLGFTTHQRSKCPHCETLIPAKYNIPILSYLWLRGKCAVCKTKISTRYPWVEFLTALVFVLAAVTQLRYKGFSWGYDVFWWELLQFTVQLYFLWSLIVVTFIDIDFRIIPDRFSLGNWALAVVACLLFADPSYVEGLAGGLLGFGMFFLLAWGYERLKGIEGLGFGDVKMMGWLGTWLGLQYVPAMILFASLSGLAIGLWQMRKSDEGMQAAIPFGPFLALAALLAWFLKNMSFSMDGLVF